jgi:fumarate reductase flavoprotein subunit
MMWVVVAAASQASVAANRAAQLGLRVVVLEKGTDDRYSATRATQAGPSTSATPTWQAPAELLKVIDTATAGFARNDVASAIATMESGSCAGCARKASSF